MRPVVITSTTALNPIVRLDEWCPGPVAIQCTVTGTVNYTVQSSLDDPNSPTNPVAVGSMTWVNTSDTNAVAATATIQTNFQFAPTFVRVLVNTGTGSVVTTILQQGVAPY